MAVRQPFGNRVFLIRFRRSPSSNSRLEASMPQFGRLAVVGAVILCEAFNQPSTKGEHKKKVFGMEMKNHNWPQQNNQFPGPIQQIFKNPSAPFINSLVNETAVATINGNQVNISKQVAYATN